MTEANVLKFVKSNKPMAEISFLLIKRLVMRDGSIIFISVEKPHRYMSYILAMHRVPQRKITYVDLGGALTVKFPITFLNHGNVRIGGFLKRDVIVLKDYSFIIIDNVEHLCHIWREETVSEWIKDIKEAAAKYNVLVFAPVRSDKCKNVLSLGEIVSIEEVMK